MKTNIVVLLLHTDNFSDDGNDNLKSSAENTGVGNGCRDMGKRGGVGNKNGRKQLENVVNLNLKVEPP